MEIFVKIFSPFQQHKNSFRGVGGALCARVRARGESVRARGESVKLRWTVRLFCSDCIF